MPDPQEFGVFVCIKPKLYLIPIHVSDHLLTELNTFSRRED